MRQRPKRDVAQEITNLIIATIEAGTLPWRRPWKKTGMGGAPLRAAGVPYTGINRLYLWAVADHYGYILIEEGDYGELPMHLIDQIVYTATGKMADEF